EIASFTGNTGGSADVFGANNGGNISNPQSFAMYNTNEPVFKSRTNTQDPAGPFTTSTRNRNATRLAFRGGLPPGPPPIPGTGDTPGNSGQFLYPGMGDSTLR